MKKTLSRMLAFGMIVLMLMSTTLFSMESEKPFKTTISTESINTINELTEAISDSSIRNNPNNINKSLEDIEKLVSSMSDPKITTAWDDENPNILYTGLKGKQHLLIKFEKTGNIINGHKLFQYSGCKGFKSFGRFTNEELKNELTEVDEQVSKMEKDYSTKYKNDDSSEAKKLKCNIKFFQDYKTRIENFISAKNDLYRLRKKDKLSAPEIIEFVNSKISFTYYLRLTDTDRIVKNCTLNEENGNVAIATIKLYLYLLGFNNLKCFTENPFTKFDDDNKNNYELLYNLIRDGLVYDELKMLWYSIMLNQSTIERDGKNNI